MRSMQIAQVLIMELLDKSCLWRRIFMRVCSVCGMDYRPFFANDDKCHGANVRIWIANLFKSMWFEIKK